jgi:hypothetical protein
VENFRLKDKHTWTSKPGFSICVIERGVVRFDYPSHWVVKPDKDALHLHDMEPSVESCDLGVSIFRVPAEFVRELPLQDTLLNTLDTDRKPYRQSDLHQIARGDLEIAWLEQSYMDAEYQRDARFRVALARGPALCLISMNYWADRAAELESVWDEVLRTLVMGLAVADPTMGPVIN